jgi:hypothetical protein
VSRASDDHDAAAILILGGARVRLFVVCEAYGCSEAARAALNAHWFETSHLDANGIWTVELMELAHWLSLTAPGDDSARFKLGHLYRSELRLRHAEFGA